MCAWLRRDAIASYVCAVCSFIISCYKHEFIGALNRILNYSRRGKHRRLWRLAVATQPPIAEHQSAPCPEGTRIYQKPTASSKGAQLWDSHPLTLSWFRKAGPTIILNIIRYASVHLRGTHFCNFLKIICKIIVKITKVSQVKIHKRDLT